MKYLFIVDTSYIFGCTNETYTLEQITNDRNANTKQMRLLQSVKRNVV
jgi:hypothetical protein